MTARTSQAFGMPEACVLLEASVIHRKATCGTGIDSLDEQRCHHSRLSVDYEVHSHASRGKIIRKRFMLESRNLEREADEL